ncbi:hypothetical protein [Microbispora sp. CA-102843]|uniref:hypothetical protein n=1 Tax=Microbispora sp. CA-102843 TaxID=3239952 RepID=UPI003D8B9286
MKGLHAATALTVLVIVTAGLAMQGSAYAAVTHLGPRLPASRGDHGPVVTKIIGGTDNQNEPRLLSPTTNRGVQIMSINAQNNASLGAFCKRPSRTCKINQNLRFYGTGSRRRGR